MKRLTNIIFTTLTVLIICLLVPSCKTSRQAQSTTDAGQQVLTTGGEWHDLRVPVKISLSSPMSISLSGRATMVRDSLINISLRVFGFEVAIANMTNDSVFLVDKHNKQYFAESLPDVMGSHKLTISQIQDLLLGRGDNNPLIFNTTGNSVKVSFNDYVTTMFGSLASLVDIDAAIKAGKINASVKWSLTSAEWNTYRQVTFKSPGSNYRRISMANVKRMLESFN